MAARGINIPIRVVNEIAAGGAEAEAQLKALTDGVVKQNARQIEVYKAAARQYAETARTAVKGSDEQRAANAALEGSLKKLAVMEGYVSAESKKLAEAQGIGGLSGSMRTAEKDAGKMSRGLIAASGAASGLGRSVAYSSLAFLGAGGLAEAMIVSVKAAESLQKAHQSLSVVIEKQNGNVKEAIPLIDKWAKAQEQFGVSMQDAETGLATAYATTHNMTTAMYAYTEALQLSKVFHLDLNMALRATSRAQIGQTSALSRYIGTVAKGTTAQQLYTLMQQRYGGQAAANTTASEKLHASLQNIEAEIGQALLPTIDKYAQKLADWLQKSKNQKKVVDDVKTAIHLMGDVIKTVAGLIHHIDQVTGSFSNTMKILIGLAVVAKINSWTGALQKLIGTEAAGTGLAGAEGKAGGLLGKLTKLKNLGPIAIAIGVVITVNEIIKKATGFDAIHNTVTSSSTTGDSTIKVGGKWYVVGSGAAYQALIDAGAHLPPIDKVTAAQEIAAAKKLGGSYHRGSPASGIGTNPGSGVGSNFNGKGASVANPAKGDTFARVDQGVDVSGKAVRAITSGHIVSVSGGMAGGTGKIIKQRFDRPVNVHGRVYYGAYYSEGTPVVQKGDHVKAGEVVMTGPSFEIGFLLGPDLVFPPLKGGLGAGTKADQSGKDLNSLIQSHGGYGGSPYGTNAPPPTTTTPTSPTTKKHHHHGPAMATAAQIRSVYITISQEIAKAGHDIAQLSAKYWKQFADKTGKAMGLSKDEVKKAIAGIPPLIDKHLKQSIEKAREKMKKLRAELKKHLTSKELANIRQQYDNLKKVVDQKLTKVEAAIKKHKAKIQKALQDALDLKNAMKQFKLDTILQNFNDAATTAFENSLKNSPQYKALQNALNMMNQLQAKVNALQQQAQTANDAFDVSNAQSNLAAAIASGDTHAIAAAQNALMNAQTNAQVDGYENQIAALDQTINGPGGLQDQWDTYQTNQETIWNQMESAWGTYSSTLESQGLLTTTNIQTYWQNFLNWYNGNFDSNGVPTGSDSTTTTTTTTTTPGKPCFTAETPVATPNGLVEIGSLSEGDEVLVWEFDSLCLVTAPITEVLVHEPGETWVLTFASGRRIETTKEHPFLVEEAWRPAGDLVPGQHVAVAMDGCLRMDEVVSTEVGPTVVTYNLHVEHDDHNYFAGGALVHNAMTKMASGGIVRRPTFALIGEKGPEAVIPLNQFRGGGDLHIHLDGPVIGSDLTKAGKELADPIYRELLRRSKRNIGLGFS